MSDKKPVGVIGLGLLGSAIVERLLAAGFDIIGQDVDSSGREELERLGGRWAESVGDIQTRTVVLSLPDESVSASVCDELRSSLSTGAVVLDTTTGDPAAMTGIGERLAADGIRYLDACIGGSSAQCREGEVIAMVGGDAEAFETIRPVLGAFAKRSFHLGPAGSGAKMKLVLNLVLGLNRAVLAEGLSLARNFQLDLETTLEVLQAGPAASAAMETKGPKMIEADFTPQARLRQHRKDVRLIVENAERSNAPVPFSVLHSELLDRLIAAGYGNEDNCAIVRAFE